jgi:hypothetical protein
VAGRNLQGLSRAKWRKAGYAVEAGEHVSRIGKIVRRHDTFGFADLIAVKPGSLVFLQVTSWSNVSARVNKIARESHGTGQWRRPILDTAKDLLSIFGIRIVVEGWKQNPNTLRWESREVEITPALLDERKKSCSDTSQQS